jgi:HD-GYP domain-containing protein (c-di-GMP phosphodiesterase class II)
VWAASRHKVNNIDVTRISSIAKSTAMVVENFRLYENLRQLFVGTVRALTRSIDAKDPYTCGHSERVASLGRRLALQTGCTPHQADRVYLCGLLHDIGKIGIPEAVLQKPGRLTDEEFDQVKRHPGVGAAILDGIDELDDIIPGVLHHHERMDGRGYPAGLAGQDIPLYARILAVADTFDAMTSPRPYRDALSVRAVVNELERYAGTQFDPVIAGALLQHDLATLVEELGRGHSAAQSAYVEKAMSGKDAS